jgi:hypothetical protein
VVNNQLSELTGNWRVIQEFNGPLIYQLDPDKPSKTISFFAADQNVLFILNREWQLYTGNSDFSFTLNKRRASSD